MRGYKKLILNMCFLAGADMQWIWTCRQ